MTNRYWQVAAGSSGRDYADAFIKWGMAFVGGESHKDTITGVRSGDVMVLKDGRSKIVAAGPVVEREGGHVGVGDKEWLKDFDGWDLSGYCYVEWHVPPGPISTQGLTRTTIERTRTEAHHQIADRLIREFPAAEIAPEPALTEDVTDNQILEFLIERGLRPAAADELTNTLRRIRLLAEYYYGNCEWRTIREHETRTFLVVPLLIALGWPEQQLKIEYPARSGRVDLVCLSKAQHEDGAKAKILFETKDFSKGLDYAPKQARTYAGSFPTCDVLVVTNGHCYKAYLQGDDGEFERRPHAYLNITRPRARYPLDPRNVKGALGLLNLLVPRARLVVE